MKRFVTDAEIVMLRKEANAAGDLEMVALCVGALDPASTPEERDECRAECVRVITEAAEQDDGL